MKKLLHTFFQMTQDKLLRLQGTLDSRLIYIKPENSLVGTNLIFEKRAQVIIKKILQNADHALQATYGLVLILNRSHVVIRISDRADKITKNFRMLQIIQGLKIAPLPSQLLHFKNQSLSVESKLSGSTFSKPINSKIECYQHAFQSIGVLHGARYGYTDSSSVAELLDRWRQFYLANNKLQHKLFEVLSLVQAQIATNNVSTQFIHGDFTFRNCTDKGELFDFDSAQKLPPCFDTITFYTDWKTHLHQKIDYETWFDEILSLLDPTQYHHFVKKAGFHGKHYSLTNSILWLYLYRVICTTIEHYEQAYGAAHSNALLVAIKHKIQSHAYK